GLKNKRLMSFLKALKSRAKSKGCQHPAAVRIRNTRAGKAAGASRKRRAAGLDLNPSTVRLRAIPRARPNAAPRVLKTMSDMEGQRVREKICRNSTETLSKVPNPTTMIFFRRDRL